MKLLLASTFIATLALAPCYMTPVNAAKYSGDCGGCTSCTAEVLERERNAKGKTIGQSISWQLKKDKMTVKKACSLICGKRFPDICGEECDPDRCDRGSFQPFTSKPDLQAAVNEYCFDPEAWEQIAILYTVYGPIENWDTTEIEDMEELFSYKVTCNPDISKWNVSKVKNFSYMFYEAYNFNQDIGGWDVSSGTDFSHMFEGATAFNQDIGGWDVSSGENFDVMFNSAYKKPQTRLACIKENFFEKEE
jgi:hypothetical protein